MAGKKAKKVLYWMAGKSPSEEDHAAADAIVGNVMFRNANFVMPDGALEDFDDLAGPAIPQRYADELERRDAVPVPEKPAPKSGVVGPNAAAGTNQKTDEASGAWSTGKVTKGQAK